MSWSRITSVWAWLACLMVLNGFFRETVLVTWVSRPTAEVLSVVLGITIILLVTRPFLAHLKPMTPGELARIGLSWLGLTVVFEIVFGYFVDGKTVQQLASAYAFWNGSLWPLVLLCVVVAPFLWAPRARDHARVA